MDDIQRHDTEPMADELLASVEEAAPVAPAGVGIGGGAPAPVPDRVIRWVIFATAFLVPLFYLPFTQDVLFAKVTLVEIAAVLITAAWLGNILVLRRIWYRRTPLNAAFLVFALVLTAATIASVAPWSSLWGADGTGEKTLSVLSCLALAFIIAAVFQPEDVRWLGRILLSSVSLLGLFTLLSIAFRGNLPAWLAVNPVGTLNALATVLAISFVFTLTFALTAKTSAGERRLSPGMARFAGAAAVMLLVALVFVGFPTAWLSIAAAMAILLALNFTKFWEGEPGAATNVVAPGPVAAYALGRSAAAVAFIILIIGLFSFFRPPSILVAKFFTPPIEVSPSFSGTVAVARSVLASRPLLGVGPAMFRLAFAHFHDPALNRTIFWQTRFGHGFSLAATLLATTGIVGVLALLALVLIAASVIGRAFWRAAASDPYRWAFGLTAIVGMLEWFLYASNFTALFITFLALGVTAVLAAEARPAEVERERGPVSWWRTARRTILVESPAINFVTSLVVVSFAAFSLLALYALGSAYAAEVYFARAADVLGRFGNTDTANVFLLRAVALNPKEDSYRMGQAQTALAAVGQIINRAAANPSQDISLQFRNEFSGGINAARAATDLSPENPDAWLMLGSLYEAVIPFIVGADQAAADAYGRASSFDPANPVIKLAKGRAFLAAADVTALAAGRAAPGETRQRLDTVAKEALGHAREELEASVALKPDFPDANFLLAQVYLRQGNISDAIRKVQDTAVLAPQDIGVAFQLGFLYYRTGDFDAAAREFRRAIALNDNYSNARYFLGLIYDRQGDRDGALSQFQKILALNPGSEEVQKIVANLQAGRGALKGIVPPEPPPESRRAPPVGEKRAAPLRR